MIDAPIEEPPARMQIVEFICGACGTPQRRVVVAGVAPTCLHRPCRKLLRIADGVLRPGLAKAFPR